MTASTPITASGMGFLAAVVADSRRTIGPTRGSKIPTDGPSRATFEQSEEVHAPTVIDDTVTVAVDDRMTTESRDNPLNSRRLPAEDLISAATAAPNSPPPLHSFDGAVGRKEMPESAMTTDNSLWNGDDIDRQGCVLESQSGGDAEHGEKKHDVGTDVTQHPPRSRAGERGHTVRRRLRGEPTPETSSQRSEPHIETRLFEADAPLPSRNVTTKSIRELQFSGSPKRQNGYPRAQSKVSRSLLQ